MTVLPKDQQQMLLHPQKHSKGYFCAAFRILLGVALVLMMATLVAAVVYVNVVYLRKEFDQQEQTLTELSLMNKDAIERMTMSCTGPRGISRIPGVEEVSFIKSPYSPWEPTIGYTDGTCQYQTRIKLEVIPCYEQFPPCSEYEFSEYGNKGMRVYCSKVVQNNFEYYLVNKGTSFKDMFQSNPMPPSSTGEGDAAVIDY